MELRFDLLGDPIPENHGGRGRPPHIVTSENRNKVMMLLAFGWKDERIARALRIAPPTLRKHYKVELKSRDDARDCLEANVAARLLYDGLGGNVGAMREFGRVLERNDSMLRLATYVAAPRPSATPQTKMGKKALRQAAADAIEGIYAPPAPPQVTQ